MKRPVLITLSILVCVGIIGIAYVLVQKNRTYVYDGPMTTVTVAPKWLHQAQFAGMYVAIERGIYERYGIEVVFDDFEMGDASFEKVMSGSADIGYMNATGLLREVERGADVVGLGVIYQHSPYAFISLKGRGLINPWQLRGTRVGIKGGTGSENDLIAQLLLDTADLTTDDVEMVSLELASSEKDDLVNEVADVVGFYRTRIHQFDQNNLAYNLITPEQYGIVSYNDVIVAKEAFVEEHPDAVRRFLAATIEGWEYALDHPEKTIDIVMNYVSHPDYQDVAYQQSILKQSTALIRPSRDFAVGSMDTEKWHRLADTLQEYEVLTSTDIVDRAVDDTYLP